MNRRNILREAKRDGKQAGIGAASWCFDGNTRSETYREFLRGWEEGDPAVLDRFNPPNLSGEYADDPTPQTLAEDYAIFEDLEHEGFLDDVCSAWEDAATSAFFAELVRIAKANV